MPASIGVNLRVTGHCRQGGRKYMEDFFTVAYQQTMDEKDLEYAFFGIYDGHGGAEAAAFAKDHLMETIIQHKSFWSENDEDVLRAIKDGYIATHYAMWKEQEKWPKTTSGLPSTAGTTASIAFIRRGKIYIGHVGDSGIVLGYQDPGSIDWKAKQLTKDHKPESPDEMRRIQGHGGKVVSKSGVPRVVWNRPKIGHQGPVRRSTPIDEIPFLAVARSLGDFWSYNSRLNQFVVSPIPDCAVYSIDTKGHRCLIFGTDGLFNMISPSMAVHVVQQAELRNETEALRDSSTMTWLNPSKLLVERALERWQATKMRADNTSVVTLMLDPPGPPKAQVLRIRKKNLPESGLKIMTRYNPEESPPTTSSQGGQPSEEQNQAAIQHNPVTELPDQLTPASGQIYNDVARNVEISEPNLPQGAKAAAEASKSSSSQSEQRPHPPVSSTDHLHHYLSNNVPLKEPNFVPKGRESTAFDPREPEKAECSNSGTSLAHKITRREDDSIQINEISSSNIEESHDESLEDAQKAIKGALREKRAPKRKADYEEPTHSARKSVRLTINQDKGESVEAEKPEAALKNPSKQNKEIKQNLDGDKKMTVGRKVEIEEAGISSRKSVRLATSLDNKSDLMQNKESHTRKPAPCTVAEEKLKKLAEEAERTKKLQELQEHNNNHINTRQIAVSVIKNVKKVEFKKKHSLRKQIAKKKIQHVLDTVMARTRRQQVEKKIPEKEKSVDKSVEKTSAEKPTTKIVKQLKKFDKKVVVTKKISNFKRQSERNTSLRNREASKLATSAAMKKEVVQNIVKNINKKIDPKSEVKENLRGRPKGAKNKKFVSVRASTRLSNNAKESGDSPKTPLNSKISESNKQSPKLKAVAKMVDQKKATATKHSLRQRIQKKTESLRRNIQRRS